MNIDDLTTQEIISILRKRLESHKCPECNSGIILAVDCAGDCCILWSEESMDDLISEQKGVTSDES